MGIVSTIISKSVDAVGIFVIGFTISIIIKGFTKKILAYANINRYASLAGIMMDLETDIAAILSYTILGLTIVWMIQALNVTRVFILLLVGITFFLLGLSLLSHSKDLPLNIWAYYILKYKRKTKKGEFIKTSQIEGIVKKMSLTQTQIETRSGEMFYAANYSLIS